MERCPFERRLGAFPLGDGRAGLRVWAPRPRAVREWALQMSDAGEVAGLAHVKW
jgi:hypothetical protein